MTAVGRFENLEKSITAKRTSLGFWDCTRRSSVLNCFIGEPCGCSVHALEHAGRIDDLKEARAIALDHVALELRLEGHRLRSSSLGTLASALLMLFERRGRVLKKPSR
ncbi:hypothetical protein A7U60_g7037 [Sanghuangporus baumii]|uniref:Uncharacterized protein n=1 Tax=Sanghuangporus baumii TaxID=108892 RepID=A0A9Q5HU41_SANBA|nr:hypothetical protein A7U60_g7037 [Sanghuangporus baumii]